MSFVDFVRLVFPEPVLTVLVGLGSHVTQWESAALMEPDATMIEMTDGLHRMFVSLESI